MQALRKITESYGHEVTGSDAATTGHDPSYIDGADLIVYTNAVPKDNCELAAARARGIPMIERAEYLGEISEHYGKVIAVAGCHGKSTVTAMLGEALRDFDPTVHVGVAGASKIGGRDLFITEACEYKESFLHLSPDIGIVLNVGFDHPDYYRDRDDIKNAYRKFCSRCKTVIVNGDDRACDGLCVNPITFGTAQNCDHRAANIDSENGLRSFTYVGGGKRADVKLRVVGAHNVNNALATLTAADLLGASDAALSGLRRFRGLPRRFERKGTAYSKAVICDYAHHPAEITATIETAREIYSSVAVVFQPHTYSRTEAMLDDFALALSHADTVILAPIFAAREKPTGITSHTLGRKIKERKQNVFCLDSTEEIIKFCAVLEEEAIIFMGAGDIDKACDAFMSSSSVRI